MAVQATLEDAAAVNSTLAISDGARPAMDGEVIPGVPNNALSLDQMKSIQPCRHAEVGQPVQKHR